MNCSLSSGIDTVRSPSTERRSAKLPLVAIASHFPSALHSTSFVKKRSFTPSFTLKSVLPAGGAASGSSVSFAPRSQASTWPLCETPTSVLASANAGTREVELGLAILVLHDVEAARADRRVPGPPIHRRHQLGRLPEPQTAIGGAEGDPLPIRIEGDRHHRVEVAPPSRVFGQVMASVSPLSRSMTATESDAQAIAPHRDAFPSGLTAIALMPPS